MKKKYTLKIEPNPSDAIVTIYKNNSVLKTGIGILEVTVLDEDELKYTVSKYGYNEINDTVKIVMYEKARVDILPIFLALVNGPLITSNASLKLKLNSLIMAAAVRLERSIVLLNAVENGVEESGEIL